jgi:hypothetical protein
MMRAIITESIAPWKNGRKASVEPEEQKRSPVVRLPIGAGSIAKSMEALL